MTVLLSRRAPAPADEPLVTGWDYADAFELRLDRPDRRTAEQWVRAGLEEAPWLVRQVVLVAHRRVLRFRLGPLHDAGHVLGWQVRTAEPDVVHLTAPSPLVAAHVVGRRLDDTSVQLRTFVAYRHPAARVVWLLVGPVHRLVAPYLLRRAAGR